MKLRSILRLITLMVVGEFIFLLPFVLPRIFRPTFLKVFDITNLEMGASFSVYGIVGMLAYFGGGPLADRYTPRQLLPISILLTALGGIIMSFIPSLFTLTLLYGFWGVTTILLFWAAYVKAQRELGGAHTQGLSFGSIDAGRGLTAALVASSSVFLLDAFIPSGIDDSSLEELTSSFSNVILIFSILTALSALLVWLYLPNEKEEYKIPRISLAGVMLALRRKSVWLQAIIVLCAYVGYKSGDDFALYATVALGYNDVDAAHMMGIVFWIRPIAAIAAGLLGDKFLHSNMIAIGFLIMSIACGAIASGVFVANSAMMVLVTMMSTGVAIYGLRGLYFALFQEAKVPLIITGSAAGFVSLVGYTPDVFMGPVMGYLLDNHPGIRGHELFFLMVTGFALIGFLVSIMFKKSYNKD